MEDSDFDSDGSDCLEERLSKKKCFDVEVPENFDPTNVPTNGVEYLQQVIYQRKKFMESEKIAMATSPPPPKPTPQTKTRSIWTDMHFYPAPKEIRYDFCWLMKKTEEFNKFRDYIWSIYDYDNMRIKPGPKCPRLSKELMLNTPPTTEMIIDMPFKKMTTAMEIINELLDDVPEGEGIPFNVGLWLYVLMAARNSITSPLRDISKKVSHIRLKLGENAPASVYTPLNLVTCLVTHSFGQYDLSDCVNMSEAYNREMIQRRVEYL